MFTHSKIALNPKFRIDDTGVFEKCNSPNFSIELFKIVKMNITNPVTYLLEELTDRSMK